MLVLLSFQASQENLNLQLPFFTWGRCERWKNNNFLFSFKLGNNEACITEDGRTDTSKIFLIKEVHLTLKERKWQTAVGRVCQTCILLVCLIRTCHCWCIRHQNPGYKYSPDDCKIFATSSQSFPLGLIAVLKNTDNTVYCVLIILWSVLCIKIQLCDLPEENLSFVVPQMFVSVSVHWKLWKAALLAES